MGRKNSGPDILHIHAVGPGLMTPLARLLGMKVVVTHHGPDYERRYFRSGDAGDLAEKLSVLPAQGVSEQEKAWFRKEIAEKYDWERIARETVRVYEKVLGFGERTF